MKPWTLRLVADVDLKGAIALGLCRRCPGLEFARLRDLGLGEATDPEILDWAAREGWVVVSHDVNTMAGHALDRLNRGLPLAGLVLVQQRLSVGAAIEDLSLLVEAGTQADFESAPIWVPF